MQKYFMLLSDVKHSLNTSFIGVYKSIGKFYIGTYINY